MIQVWVYMVDCKDPGPWATTASLQMSDGREMGVRLSIETLETERQGRLCACSQPLFADKPSLHNWWAH